MENLHPSGALNRRYKAGESVSFFTENFSSTNAAESMFNKWSYRFPDPRLHPIVVWDDIVTNRYRSEGCADPDQLITWGILSDKHITTVFTS